VFEEWLTVKQAAAYCGVSRWFLSDHRGDGIGPPYHQRGVRILYTRPELDEWIKRNRRGL